MRRALLISAGIAGVAVAAGAGALLWSANYAAAVWLLSRQSAIWLRFFNGEIWLPAMQAWTWRGLPIVSKLLGIATGGLAVEAAVIAGGGYFSDRDALEGAQTQRRLAHRDDDGLEKGRAARRRRRHFDAAGHVQRAGRSL